MLIRFSQFSKFVWFKQMSVEIIAPRVSLEKNGLEV